MKSRITNLTEKERYELGVMLSKSLMRMRMTKAELARQVGCPRPIISHLCNGHHVNIHNNGLLKKIARKLNIDEEYLLGKAGILPEDIFKILKREPTKCFDLIRASAKFDNDTIELLAKAATPKDQEHP